MAQWFSAARQAIAGIAGIALLTTSVWTGPALAKDPFRTSNGRDISDRTEAAFRALFEEGNYKKAAKLLQEVESDSDPLAYGMQASLAFVKGDKTAFKQYADKTLAAAQELVKEDSLRGNIYLAAGHFLQGGYAVLTDGTVKGAPEALSRLQQVYDHLDAAEAEAPNDPELSLVKGYMDLMVSVVLPFSSPNEAIEQLQNNARPVYLVDRGLAVAYRDMKKHSKALDAVNRALKATPDNPDLLYLKAQILVNQGNKPAALPLFAKAIEQEDQLPNRLTAQIDYEHCKARESVEKIDLPCQSRRKAIRRGELRASQ